ncbi:hypothetical protein NP493_223g01004 [Ridgeia piscesae]|uniref:RRM domain-containing protein n=1 Tax=Ridgeia piscesae TaxID=27915 RepID=A0AAD9UDX6_RIDPI|nr:hypothetical protein NP493_223g01004 [Ridgeia piscesae]
MSDKQMGTRVYIGRLSYHVRERDIEKFFRGYGRIREIMLKNGYGFVEFDDQRDADDAVYELSGKDLCGERVVLEHARGPSSRRGRDSFRESSRSDDYGYRRRSSWIDKVEIEYARGTPRGSDYWRDQERGYDFPRRHGGGRDK